MINSYCFIAAKFTVMCHGCHRKYIDSFMVVSYYHKIKSYKTIICIFMNFSYSLQVLVSRLCSFHKMNQIFPLFTSATQQILEYLLLVTGNCMAEIISILEELANKPKLNQSLKII